MIHSLVGNSAGGGIAHAAPGLDPAIGIEQSTQHIEAPLAAGVVDVFRARGLRIFGPTKAAAQLESSKAFAKDFMKRHRIPTAAYETFDAADAAHAYIDKIVRSLDLKKGEMLIEIGAGHHRHNARNRKRRSNVDGANSRVSMRAAQDLAMQHVREL